MDKTFEFLMICFFGFMVLATGIAVFAFGKEVFKNDKCTDQELNVVIEKVNACKKQSVLCSEKEIDRILKEICK